MLQEERRIKVISVEDELFETIWRGMDARGDPRGLWLADALGIVTGGEPVQWAVLAELARRHGACQGVAAALTMIAEVIDAPPAMTAARDRLLAADESWVDRTAMRLRARPWGGIFGLSGRLVLAFLGESRRAGQTPGPRGFLTFLGRRWGTSTAGETIAAATARLKRHARRRRGTRRAP